MPRAGAAGPPTRTIRWARPMTRCSRPTASARPPYAALDARLSTLPLEELNRRQQACEQCFLHQGITFTVYNDNQATERIIPDRSSAAHRHRRRNGTASSAA